jgi:hypothetical protein
MVYDILGIVVQNLNTNDLIDLSNIAVTSKRHNDMLYHKWANAKIPSKEWWMTRYAQRNKGSCTRCNKTRNLNVFGECHSCQNRIDNALLDKYDAKCLWNVDEKELGHLPYIIGTNTILRNEQRYYKEHDVIMMSVYKHKGPERVSYVTALNEKQKTRLFKVLSIPCAQKIEMHTLNWKNHIEPYIRTGKGGIKTLAAYLEANANDSRGNIRWHVR